MSINKILIICLLFSPAAFATQGSEIGTINKALEGYVAHGIKGVEEEWPMLDSVDITPLTNTLSAIEKYYGNIVDYDLIRSDEISRRVKVVYLGLNYENGAAFIRVQTYRKHNNKVLFNYVNVHTEFQTYFSSK